MLLTERHNWKVFPWWNCPNTVTIRRHMCVFILRKSSNQSPTITFSTERNRSQSAYISLQSYQDHLVSARKFAYQKLVPRHHEDIFVRTYFWQESTHPVILPGTDIVWLATRCDLLIKYKSTSFVQDSISMEVVTKTIKQTRKTLLRTHIVTYNLGGRGTITLSVHRFCTDLIDCLGVTTSFKKLQSKLPKRKYTWTHDEMWKMTNDHRKKMNK